MELTRRSFFGVVTAGFVAAVMPEEHVLGVLRREEVAYTIVFPDESQWVFAGAVGSERVLEDVQEMIRLCEADRKYHPWP